MIGGQATRTWISLGRPNAGSAAKDLQRGRADDRVLDQNHALAFQHLAQRRVFGLGLALAVAAALDERAAGVAVADQAFRRRGFSGRRPWRRPPPCWYRARARPLCLDRWSGFPAGPTPRPGLARQVHAPPVHRAGHVGEINPFEKAMGVRRRRRTLDFQFAVGNRLSAWPGGTGLISPAKPRLSSATLSLAAAKNGPSTA